MSGLKGGSTLTRRAALCAVLTFAAGVIGCSRTGPVASAGGASHALLGAQAPGFELPAVSGGAPVSLSAHAGKVVIVDFWATWCEPCRESFPAYQKLVDAFGGQLVVIGVSVDESSEAVSGFASETGARFPLVWDSAQSVAQAYSPPAMPTSFIIDQNGIVRFVHSGFHSGDEALIESQVKSLLK